MHKQGKRRTVVGVVGVLGLLLCMNSGVSLAQPAGQVDSAGARLAQAGVQLAWQISLPLAHSVSIRSYHLMEENIYALASDGKVHCVRADIGRYRWVCQVVGKTDTLWPPVLYPASWGDELGGAAVGFTRIHDVVFFSTVGGIKVGTRRTQAVNKAAAVMGPNAIYTIELDKCVGKYNIEERYLDWQIRSNDLLQISPLYLADQGQLVFVDEGGRVASADGDDKEEIFDQRVDGRPCGWLAGDAEGIYLVTDQNLFYHLDRRTGEALGKYYLMAAPDGGPVVKDEHIYQAMAPRGVVQINKARQAIGWRIDQARRFLAEWPRQVVLLNTNHQLVFVDPLSGKVERLTDLGEPCDGISNTVNDAVFITTRGGTIRCLRPLGSEPLTAADFATRTTALMETHDNSLDESSEPISTDGEL
ncbi:MAG: PQQ-binding-like beta-propeller repeat protein [Phycisphaerales bacterium]|nr:PQQ-binding-like beta-propeller repeat protein [Phycisphaerales bacterium]